MIQLIARCMAFHSAFSKTKLKFKMWFLLSLWIKLWFQVVLGRGNGSGTQGIKWHMKWVSRQFEFLEISRASSSVAKNSVFKEKKRRNRSMKGCIAINGRDEASFDRIIMFNWWSSDRQWSLQMHPHIVCEETRSLISCVGSWSGDRD